VRHFASLLVRYENAVASHSLEFAVQNAMRYRLSATLIVCDTGVLSRVWWLVGPLKLRVTIQLTLSLRLLKMYCD